MRKGPVTPKGFRDIKPSLAQKRRRVINKVAEVLESFEFEPLETPTIEFAETLLGKYGEDEKLIYKFIDKGGRDLALRYDLTVPLARFIANNLGLIEGGKVFRRYQVGQVFRGENPQKGRYREFTQFDFDSVGSNDLLEDAKVIAASIKAAKEIGSKKPLMAINDRENFKNISLGDIRQIDKIHKIGKENIKKELLNFIETSKPTISLEKLFEILKTKYSLKEGSDFIFDPTLARGLDYYTGTIMELKADSRLEALSIGGGGRYDKLIGMFAGQEIPAVGFSFGVDRLIELSDVS